MKRKSDPILRTTFVNFITWKIAELIRYQANKFVCIVQVNKERNKVLQIIFRPDGSLYVSFPYFDNNHGIVSVGTLSEISLKTHIKLEASGKVTTNKVKYAHHPSGVVHFSQTGRVKTDIRKRAIALNKAEGHLFTFHAQGLSHFESDSKQSDNTPSLNQIELSFKFDGVIPKAVKIIGMWYETRTFMSRTKGTSFGPVVSAENPNGKQSKMFLIGPPESYPLKDYVLALGCEEIPVLDKEQEASMLFLGGFGGSQNNPLYQKESFLCALYPVLDYDDIEKRIGSIDLV